MLGKRDRTSLFTTKLWNEESILYPRYHKPHIYIAISPRPYYHKPCDAWIAQCAQCVLYIMSTSLRSNPRVLIRACVHEVLDAHALAIMHLAT